MSEANPQGPEQGSGADDVVATVIPYKNPKALIGYYLGVFSLIPCLGGLLGPAALILGILGLHDRKKNPQMRGTAHAVVAIVLGSITTLAHLVVLVVSIIASMQR
jgi:uncharacterized protein YqgC (DUF456 family)